MSAGRDRFVLDTDTLTALQFSDQDVVTQLARHSPTEIATTVVTMYEQLRGRLADVNRGTRDIFALQTAYWQLQGTYDS